MPNVKPLNKALIACLAAFAIAPPAFAAPPPAPKLIVAISIDQFSANLFERYRGKFQFGLRRLASQGVAFPNGYQSHAATETCPGHSTLLTGRHPSATGVVANNWRDPATGKDVYCMLDPAHPVPGRPGQGRGPANLRVSALGEWMRAANPASRTVAVSGKDRGAIPMAGHDPAGVFWWDFERDFTTSVPAGTQEADRLAPIATFNAALDARWRKAPPVWKVADPTCKMPPQTRRYGALEVTHSVPPAGFETPKRGSDFRADATFNAWFRATPTFDETVIDAANHLIDGYKLGRGAAPDLLAVSLSATDYIGHRYGNDGPEMCDQMAHLDRLLGGFLDRLDRLGVPVVVVLSADHGSIDAAERVAERGVPARRVSMSGVVKEVGAAVQSELKLASNPLLGDDQVTVVGIADPAQRKRVVVAAMAALQRRPEVAAVFAREDLLAIKVPPHKPVDELTLAERFAESTDPERSGDIAVAAAPYTSPGSPKSFGDAISSHGSPWNYDRRVPILFWWKGADAFEQPIAIETVDIAPTLAGVLSVAAPQVDGVCRDLDRGAGDTCRSMPAR
jgi:predicted AlkP superfamily pyrophosphatase or phosphodiesterase